jgi:hypothetical protein
MVAMLAMSLEHMGCGSEAPIGNRDTDGDGISDADESNAHGTSPVLSDTDGDGFSDRQEIVTLGFDPESDPTLFNPRVADVPQMTIVFAGAPVVTIQTTDEHGTVNTIETSRSDTDGTGVTQGVTETRESSDTLTTSQTRADERSRTDTLGARLATTFDWEIVDAGTACGAACGDASDGSRHGVPLEIPIPSVVGGSTGRERSNELAVTLTNALSTSVSPSTTFAASVAFTDEQMRENSRTLGETRGLAEAHTITASAAFLKLVAVIHNRGHLGFRITNVILAAAFVDGSGGLTPIQNLVIDQGINTTFQPFSLAPGEQTGPTNFVSPPLTLQTAEALLAKAHAIEIRLGTYEIVDATGKSFAFSLGEIGAKTALVAIDYGTQRPSEVYNVATRGDRDRPGVTAAKALREILRVPYEADRSSGLRSVRGVASDPAGSDRWIVHRLHKNGPDTIGTAYDGRREPYDFDAIELRTGDVLHLSLARTPHQAPSRSVAKSDAPRSMPP